MRILFLSIVLLLSACSSRFPDSAYENRGQPENLLTVTSEKVVFSVVDRGSVESVIAWVQDDMPTRAELNCSEGTQSCNAIKNFLAKIGVPFSPSAGQSESITLVYDRVTARDCRNDFITNHVNPYNINHPTFGCSSAANQVRMVSDQRDFVRPRLSDPANAEKATHNFDLYMEEDRPY